MEREEGLKRDPETVREPTSGERKPAGDLSAMAGIETAAPLPSSARNAGADSEVAGPAMPAFLCAMCRHSSLFHTAGTDGAGWCAGSDFCECGGFQG